MSLSKLAMLASIRIYSLLLLLYPKNFRSEYGAEIMMLFQDISYDEIRERGCWGILSVWSLVLPELWITAREQHLLAGSYYRFRRMRNRLVQAVVSLIVLVLGCLYLFYVQ